MKQVWRQDEQSLYLPKGVQRINIPKMTFLTLAGVGDPNTETFGQQIQALELRLAHVIKAKWVHVYRLPT